MKNNLALLGGKPVLDKKLPLFNRIGEEELAQVMKVFDSGELSGFIGAWGNGFNGGKFVQEFEQFFTDIFNCKHAISLNSNSTGLIASLGAVGVSPGDEVIVPPYTMSATAIAPLFYGGIPVFADIEEDYFCLDINSVEKEINERTKAIVAVNLFGHPAQLIELKQIADKHNIYLIEDNAQAPFAKEKELYTGTIGHIGVFSLNRHKHIQTGEGGVCITNDDELALRLKAIRNHGENIIDELKPDNISNLIGFNFRLTELSAAVGIAQLKKANEIINTRIDIAERLSDGLSGLEGITCPKIRTGCRHVYYLSAFRYDEKKIGITRELFVEALNAEGLTINQGYVKPLYHLPVFKRKKAIGKYGFPFSLSERDYSEHVCPVAERMHQKELMQYLVCSFDPTTEQVNKMIDAFHKVYEQIDKLLEIEKR